MQEDLQIIKEKYGEKMMHFCRELFPTILENKGFLPQILEQNFEYSKILYEDIKNNNLEEDFKDYIYSMIDVETKQIVTNKTPQELLKLAGYTLYECKTEEDIQKFKKYYTEKEELCTFKGGRLEKCYVFFAIKNNIETIKRENFKTPKRQDEYGTSVISIQFTKGNINTISIKNRYNHTVNNPDATFSNNLDNIIPGLKKSFQKKYKLNFENNNTLEIPQYIKDENGKYYKYNYKINNTYYCTNNIIINNSKVERKYQSEKYLIIDYFIINLEEKTIESQYSFLDNIQEKIIKINIINGKERTKNILIKTNENTILIVSDKNNRIISFTNQKAKILKNNYLKNCKYIEELNLPNVIKIEDNVLKNNLNLKIINIPNIFSIGNNSLTHLNKITNINLQNLIEIGNHSLEYIENIKKINTPNLNKIGDYVFANADSLEEINIQNITEMGEYALEYVCNLKEINLPNIKKLKSFVLYNINNAKSINISNVTSIEDYSLEYANSLEKIYMPKIVSIGNYVLYQAPNIKKININVIPKIGTNTLPDKTKHFLQKEKIKHSIYNSKIKKIINISNTIKNKIKNILKTEEQIEEEKKGKQKIK